MGKVKADAGQLEQVIMNLSVNARDAMPEGGEPDHRDGDRSMAQEVRSAGFRSSRPHVRLSVRDTGVGMDMHTRTRLFEPFFTTKDRGKGTGLGLSTVYGIVKQHGGEIRVESEQGEGTTFNIYFPAADETRTAPRTQPRVFEAAAKGTETVLLVEDEIGVRQLAREILKLHGYRVLEAADAREAIRLAQQERGPIHVLLTDVIMPLMSGRELVEQIRPCARIFASSTCRATPTMCWRIAETSGPDINFLQKPFAPEALTKKVREALER